MEFKLNIETCDANDWSVCVIKKRVEKKVGK